MEMDVSRWGNQPSRARVTPNSRLETEFGSDKLKFPFCVDFDAH